MNDSPERSSALLFFHADMESWEDVLAEIDAGVDVNARDPQGNTVLLYAAETGDRSIVEHLLNRGADVSARDSQGNTALTVAVEHGNDELVPILRAAEQAHQLRITLPSAPAPGAPRVRPKF